MSELKAGCLYRLEMLSKDAWGVQKRVAIVHVLHVDSRTEDSKGRKGTYFAWNLVKEIEGGWGSSGSCWVYERPLEFGVQGVEYVGVLPERRDHPVILKGNPAYDLMM